MGDVGRQRERAPLAEQPSLTDEACGDRHQAPLGKGVGAPSMPTRNGTQKRDTWSRKRRITS